MISLIPIAGLGEISPGDDLGQLLAEAVLANGLVWEEDDILVVTHKVVSKAEGRLEFVPDDAAYRKVVESEAAAILRRRGDLVIAVTHHGFICANAGVDRSNVEGGRAVLLPADPDSSAHRLRNRLGHLAGARPAVIITDTFGRAWRRGLVDVAIGVAGMAAVHDLRGETDSHGRVLEVTEIATADEIAAAAELVMGKNGGVPAVIVRGFRYPRGEGSVGDLLRPDQEDLFR